MSMASFLIPSADRAASKTSKAGLAACAAWLPRNPLDPITSNLGFSDDIGLTIYVPSRTEHWSRRTWVTEC